MKTPVAIVGPVLGALRNACRCRQGRAILLCASLASAAGFAPRAAAAPGVGVSPSVFPGTTICMGDPFSYRIGLVNKGDVALDRMVFTDELPPNFALTSIELGYFNNDPGGNFIAARYRTSADASLQNWPGSPFPENDVLQVSALGLDPGVYISYVELEFFAPAPPPGLLPGFQTSGVGSEVLRLNGTILPMGWDTPPTVKYPGDTVSNSVAVFGYLAPATNPVAQQAKTVVITLCDQVDLSLLKTVSSTSPRVGDEVTFTLMLSNAVGYSTATAVTVADVVPSGYTYVAGSISGGDGQAVSGPEPRLTWTVNSLAGGGSVPLSFRALVLPMGDYENYAQVTAHNTPPEDIDSTPGNGPQDPDEDDDDTATVSPLSEDWGDAPEGALAYPPAPTAGAFPTCKSVALSGFIRHGLGWAFFGPSWDPELDGNSGLCPVGWYDQDECFNDVDAGLITPGSYTIQGAPGSETIVLCPLVPPSTSTAIGTTCTMAAWGTDIDIFVTNNMPVAGYVNVLIDWDQSGSWGASSPCSVGPAPEHVLVNLLVPQGHAGPLSALGPPPFLVGPKPGHAWARFTITERPVTLPWDGSGQFEDGETEDYLLRVEGIPSLSFDKAITGGSPYDSVGDVVSYAYTITNTGNLTLAGPFTVTDDRAGTLTASGPLAPLGTVTVTGSYTVTQADLDAGSVVNSAHATTTYNSQLVTSNTDTATATATGTQVARISIQKLTNGQDVGAPPGPSIAVGSVATWTYLVKNPGNVALAAVTVSDSQGVVPVRIGGDTGGDNILDPGEVWEYRATGIAVAGLYTNVGTARGAPRGGQQVTATDTSWYTGVPYDFGDAPDPAYPTLLASTGARHRIVPGLRMGAKVDAEPDGQPAIAANGDDLAGVDDEDGVAPAQLALAMGGVPKITVAVHNATGQAATVTGWIDYNQDGVWESAEKATAVAGPGVTSVTLTFPQVPAPWGPDCLSDQALYVLDGAIRLLRYDLATGGVSVCATGFVGAFDLAADDLGNIYVVDYGAATVYRVPAGCGPKQALLKWTRGGPPTPWAITYQNGYLYLSDRVMNRILEIDPVTGSSATYINGVVDPVALSFDAAGNAYVATHNGAYLAKYGPGGVLLTGEWVSPALGYVDISDVLADAWSYQTYARFRISTDARSVEVPTGDAPDGEVEDYVVTVLSQPGYLLFSGNDKNVVYACDANGDCIELAGSWADGLQNPFGLAVDCEGRLFVSSSGRVSIVVIDPVTGQSTVWDDSRGGLLPVAGPYGLLIVDEP